MGQWSSGYEVKKSGHESVNSSGVFSTNSLIFFFYF